MPDTGVRQINLTLSVRQNPVSERNAADLCWKVAILVNLTGQIAQTVAV